MKIGCGTSSRIGAGVSAASRSGVKNAVSSPTSAVAQAPPLEQSGTRQAGLGVEQRQPVAPVLGARQQHRPLQGDVAALRPRQPLGAVEHRRGFIEPPRLFEQLGQPSERRQRVRHPRDCAAQMGGAGDQSSRSDRILPSIISGCGLAGSVAMAARQAASASTTRPLSNSIMARSSCGQRGWESIAIASRNRRSAPAVSPRPRWVKARISIASSDARSCNRASAASLSASAWRPD